MLSEMNKNIHASSTETAKLNKTIELLSAKISELVDDGKRKDIKIEYLEEKINELEQKALCKNIEIVNAPTTKEPLETMLLIAAAADANINANEIEKVFRTKKKQETYLKIVHSVNCVI